MASKPLLSKECFADGRGLAGIPKGQYKGYTCPQCTRAKVSAQHHRQRDKRKKVVSTAEKSGGGPSATADAVEAPRKQPIFDVDGLVTAVLDDCQSDPTTLQPLRQSFKRLLQIQRAFKAEEEQLVNVWKPFSKVAFPPTNQFPSFALRCALLTQLIPLRSAMCRSCTKPSVGTSRRPTCKQPLFSSSLLRPVLMVKARMCRRSVRRLQVCLHYAGNSAIDGGYAAVDGDNAGISGASADISSDVAAEHLFKLIPSPVLQDLDANQDYGRCQPL